MSKPDGRYGTNNVDNDFNTNHRPWGYLSWVLAMRIIAFIAGTHKRYPYATVNHGLSSIIALA
jgi:hypothetical protein